MADAALFLGWNRAVPGRENLAMQLFADGMALYAKLQKAGRIESFEPVLLSAHGGDLNGFVLLRGERQKLDQLRTDEEFMKFAFRAGYCLQGFGVVTAYLGNSIEKNLSTYRETIAK